MKSTGARPEEHLRRMQTMARSLGFRKVESHYDASLAALAGRTE